MRQHALRGQTHPAAKYYRHCCVVIKQTFKQLHVVAGFTYPHKVRQPHSAAAISGRQVVSARDSPPGPSSASELAPAAAPDGTQPRGGQPESPALSQEGQSWREASLPTAEALSTLGKFDQVDAVLQALFSHSNLCCHASSMPLFCGAWSFGSACSPLCVA